MQDFENSLRRFDTEAEELYLAARSSAEQYGHLVIDTYHYCLAWLIKRRFAPARVSASRYEDGLEILVKRESRVVEEKKVSVAPGLAYAFDFAVRDSQLFAVEQTLIDYRWIIPNLFDGRRCAAQIIGILGIDIVEFFLATLNLLGEPFPKLADHYLKRLHLESCKRETSILLHRRPN